jgi:hypothetical protein
MATSRKRKVVAKAVQVAYHRQGLSLAVDGVHPADTEQVASLLLDIIRGLAKRYPELTMDGGTFHAGPYGEVTPDDHAEESKKRIGFRTTNL